ncbi:hypothetical protein H2248_003606 [Termitomyces sp. 'cryptogamus']|nr:hypothetical protein H2248_003606 [Termitomyces sp. 'cryptogamus']
MPQSQPYAASVNPDRRAKQISTPTERTTQRTILPQPASPPSTDGSEFEPNSVQAPVKRGRKPGPLSRAARETQRKLNHSIIEKARRTKINDALTSLKQLVPAGYGQSSPQPADEDEDAKKKKGKKEEKEKEFKLEILERTVVFLQDLLKRVEVFEAAVSSSPKDRSLCAKCSSPLSPSFSSSTSYPDQDQPVLKRKRSLSSHSPASNLDMSLEPSPKRPRLHASPRLPSISSWLPDPDSVPVRYIDIDPHPLDTAAHFSPNNTTGHLFPTECNTLATGLPSPPASTHFAPQKRPFLSSSVPTLHLGASASSSTLKSPSHGPSLSRMSGPGKPSYSPPSESYRTPLLSPEDENAASLLLQISAGGSGPSHTLHGGRGGQAIVRQASHVETGNGNVQAQTPGSILGLNQLGMARRG